MPFFYWVCFIFCLLPQMVYVTKAVGINLTASACLCNVLIVSRWSSIYPFSKVSTFISLTLGLIFRRHKFFAQSRSRIVHEGHMCFGSRMRKRSSCALLSKNSNRWSSFTPAPAESRCSASSNISEVMQPAEFLGCFNRLSPTPRGGGALGLSCCWSH